MEVVERSFPLLSCESWMFMKENPNIKKKDLIESETNNIPDISPIGSLNYYSSFLFHNIFTRKKKLICLRKLEGFAHVPLFVYMYLWVYATLWFSRITQTMKEYWLCIPADLWRYFWNLVPLIDQTLRFWYRAFCSCAYSMLWSNDHMACLPLFS